MDVRILTRQYGRYFLNALPPMPVERFRLEEYAPDYGADDGPASGPWRSQDGPAAD